jgi:hypothetical protein
MAARDAWLAAVDDLVVSGLRMQAVKGACLGTVVNDMIADLRNEDRALEQRLKETWDAYQAALQAGNP